jgi:bifunctional UDP-N-acetylglucosamine pyrophosphorylase/glucosamine-1-phosphate N-acetyltransferase
METPITAIILAAGLGTRMKSKHAKVMHEVGGMPIVEHVVRTAMQFAAPERVFVVVGNRAEQVQAALAPLGVQFVLQSEQKGTGHAIAVCREAVSGASGPLLVLYGDAPLLQAATLRRLIDEQRGSGAAASVLTTVLENPTGYGRILRDRDGGVGAIVEEKAATPEQRKVGEINSGIYCFNGGLLWQYLGEIGTDNPAGEYYLTDIVEIFRRAGHATRPVLVQDANELLGINTRAELAVVDRVFRDRKTRELMLDGVTIRKPETVTIDAAVRIGRDTIVEPFAQILGRTIIGEDCRIGACSVLRDAALGDQVEVGPFTVIDSSQVDAGAHVGPFARLRMQAHLEAGASVGNFVEVKKSRLGRKTKSMHLAYLGDSTIGAGVNIGAGTITCNYDGVRKNPTLIQDGAFVGSNSTLVAPVEIGAGSYVGAGSVVTHDVPPDALAVGRARQMNKEGWAGRRREKTNKPPTDADERR